jgi:hypothetical protein
LYGSPAARALYCSVDAETYRPTAAPKRWDLSYLGTYSDDRQPTLNALLVDAARQAPHLKFCVAGPQYPADIAWPDNVERLEHVAPADHPAFYSASRFTLNVTRADMIAAGYSPSVRLFEAAACGVPIISDVWPGLDELFEPGREIAFATDTAAVLGLLNAPPSGGRTARRGRASPHPGSAHRSPPGARTGAPPARGPGSRPRHPLPRFRGFRLCRSLRRPKPSPSWSPAAPASSDRTSASA